jgi:hypothetical protein
MCLAAEIFRRHPADIPANILANVADDENARVKAGQLILGKIPLFGLTDRRGNDGSFR